MTEQTKYEQSGRNNQEFAMDHQLNGFTSISLAECEKAAEIKQRTKYMYSVAAERKSA